VDEEGEEDGEAEGWVGVIGCVRDEALGYLMQGDCARGLEAEGEKDIGGDVMVVVVVVVVLLLLLLLLLLGRYSGIVGVAMM